MFAGVAQLADAMHSKCIVLTDMWVRIPPPAQTIENRVEMLGFLFVCRTCRVRVIIESFEVVILEV